MIISNSKKRIKVVKKIFIISFVLLSFMTFVLTTNSNELLSNKYTDDEIISVAEFTDVKSKVRTKAYSQVEDIDENLIQAKNELDELLKLRAKDNKKVNKVSFHIDGKLIELHARQATLKDVLNAFAEEFEVSLRDHTSTYNQLDVEKTFKLSGNLFDLVDSVLRLYGYDNFVLNSNPGDMHALITVFLLEPPDYDIAYSEEDNELVASTSQSTGLVSKLLSKQAVVISNSSNSLGTTGNTALVEKSKSSQQAINIAEAKRLFEASENTIALGPDVDLSQGIPPEVQQQLSQLSKQVMVDAQGLTNALLNAEAQLKANQFTNAQ